MQSESINELATALSAAQGEFLPVRKNSRNPFFKSMYADLAEVRAATTPALAKYKLAVMQTPEIRDGAFVLVSKLMHASGQWVEATFPLSTKAKIQEMGSEITYVRRYCLSSLLGVASEIDDDGNNASREKESHPRNGTSPGDHSVIERAEDAPCYAYDLNKIEDDKSSSAAENWIKRQPDVKPDAERPGVWMSAHPLKRLAAYQIEA